ncbi:hypothetical protein CY35_11G073000 [Sphagnum magellanicum]|nr:hypothetical protein CY35_11G073000 [Sphagnum magellanicum]
MQCVGHAAGCGLSENWNSHFACFFSTFTTSFPAPCFLPDMPQQHIIQQLVLWSLTVVCMLRLDLQPLRNCFQECNWNRKCVLPSVVRLWWVLTDLPLLTESHNMLRKAVDSIQTIMLPNS